MAGRWSYRTCTQTKMWEWQMNEQYLVYEVHTQRLRHTQVKYVGSNHNVSWRIKQNATWRTNRCTSSSDGVAVYQQLSVNVEDGFSQQVLQNLVHRDETRWQHVCWTHGGTLDGRPTKQTISCCAKWLYACLVFLASTGTFSCTLRKQQHYSMTAADLRHQLIN